MSCASTGAADMLNTSSRQPDFGAMCHTTGPNGPTVKLTAYERAGGLRGRRRWPSQNLFHNLESHGPMANPDGRPRSETVKLTKTALRSPTRRKNCGVVPPRQSGRASAQECPSQFQNPTAVESNECAKHSERSAMPDHGCGDFRSGHAIRLPFCGFQRFNRAICAADQRTALADHVCTRRKLQSQRRLQGRSSGRCRP